MRIFVLRMLATICGLALPLMLGSGFASAADQLIGKKYSDATTLISKWNGSAVVATVSGSALALDDCIVSSWGKSIFLNSNGDNRRSNEYRLNLNCNNPLASPGHPGNSLMTPEGVKAKADQDKKADELRVANNINTNPDGCRTSPDKLKNCINFCKRTELCELEA